MREKRTILPAVAIIFDDDRRILMTQREEPTSRFHKFWQVPGGGIEFGETPHETALREVKEEVGLTVELLTKHPFVFSRIDENAESQTIVFGFPAKHISGEIDTSNDPHTGEAKWMHYDDIDFSKTIPLTKEFIDEALQFKRNQ